MTDELLCEINVKSPLIQSSHSLPLTIRRQFDLQISSKRTPKAFTHLVARGPGNRLVPGVMCVHYFVQSVFG